MNETLSNTQWNNCTRIATRSYSTFVRPINRVGNLTGANALDVASIGIDLALLTKDILILTDAYQRVHLELEVKNDTKADGIRADGSFGEHSRIPVEYRRDTHHWNLQRNMLECSITETMVSPDLLRSYLVLTRHRY